MSVKALGWAFDADISDPLSKLVLLAIANNHNEAHGIAWPSIAHLCRVTGATERTVQRKLADLEDRGLIRRAYRNGRSTQYHLLFDTPVTVTPPSHSHPTPVTVTPRTYNEPLKKKTRAKIKIKDWTPSAADEAYAREKGHDPATILESIRLWDEANGHRAAYVSPSAFYRQWVNRERPPRNGAVRSPEVVYEDKQLRSAKMWLRKWDDISPGLQRDLRHQNPVLDRMIKQNEKSAVGGVDLCGDKD
tara:strand:- start:323 stop:1063 length:741 start_codon:yes stop_codon:yes gene_type:complete